MGIDDLRELPKIFISLLLFHSEMCLPSLVHSKLVKSLSGQKPSVVKNLPANAGDTRDVVSIPGLGGSPGEGNGNPLQCSCQENPMDRGAWQATVHGVAKSRTRFSNLTATYTLFQILFPYI